MEKQNIGNYGWNAKQMAKVNIRRQERGREPLLNKSMADEGYSDDYERYYEDIKKKKKQAKQSSSEAPVEKTLKQKIASDTESFRKKREIDQEAFRDKFNKRKMLPSSMSGMKGAVSSPSIGSSYKRGVT